MKKMMAFILAAIMCVSLVACGSKETDTTNDNAATEAQTSSAEVETVETPSESTTSNETPEAAFDTKWAGSDYEMPIPEPPFAYEIDVRDNGVKIRSTNGGVDGDVTHDNILAYCNTLKEVGFRIDVRENVIGERYGRTCYEFSGKHENGNSVELLDDGGGVVIFAYFDINAAK